uniref:Uncharacterized protein n=1 Tax=Arundo donax TaxID=35708 RepID=A0A0A9TT79_ARUDO
MFLFQSARELKL